MELDVPPIRNEGLAPTVTQPPPRWVLAELIFAVSSPKNLVWGEWFVRATVGHSEAAMVTWDKPKLNFKPAALSETEVTRSCVKSTANQGPDGSESNPSDKRPADPLTSFIWDKYF